MIFCPTTTSFTALFVGTMLLLGSFFAAPVHAYHCGPGECCLENFVVADAHPMDPDPTRTLDNNGNINIVKASGTFTASGITISDGGSGNPIVIYDTDTPAGADRDLYLGRGMLNALIVQDVTDSRPNDDANGGFIEIIFPCLAKDIDITFIDIEERPYVDFYGPTGSSISRVIPEQTRNNEFRTERFNMVGVATILVKFRGSAAISDVRFCCPCI